MKIDRCPARFEKNAPLLLTGRDALECRDCDENRDALVYSAFGARNRTIPSMHESRGADRVPKDITHCKYAFCGQRVGSGC